MNQLRYKKFLLKPLFFISSLLVGTGFVLWIEKLKPSDLGAYKSIFQKEVVIGKRNYYPLKISTGKLTPEEINFAKIAWRYFENNYHDSTGFVNSTDKSDFITIGDMTAYLMGMLSAYEIGIIDSAELDKRITGFFQSLEKLPLYDNKLPNIFYHPFTLQMLDENYHITKRGVGWSAIEIGRFFSFVNKIVFDYPQYHSALRKAMSYWKVEDMLIDGFLYGITQKKNDTIHYKTQEGTLGYEEYCSKGLMMNGYDVAEAKSYTDFTKFITVYENEIAVDTRESEFFLSYNSIQSEPYILDGIEYGWDINSRELSYRIYNVQKDRFRNTGLYTAIGNDYIDQAPYFIYNSVFANNKTWNCSDKEGNDSEDLKCLSTKSAFGWYVLFKDDYSELLFNNIKHLYNDKRGWYSGRFEKTGEVNKTITATTNGIILEALNYKMNGNIIRF